eukprot:TRINITY_DN958_c0_g1_i1.p1 TRINITY_DN958_c0_g1~~TRINITY_DN958_c0_g1_i1.p1  ORF type:complete len:189 (-),score=22.69 TRINITY_DN958_c0_g1_i1:138-704(-)
MLQAVQAPPNFQKLDEGTMHNYFRTQLDSPGSSQIVKFRVCYDGANKSDITPRNEHMSVTDKSPHTVGDRSLLKDLKSPSPVAAFQKSSKAVTASGHSDAIHRGKTTPVGNDFKRQYEQANAKLLEQEKHLLEVCREKNRIEHELRRLKTGIVMKPSLKEKVRGIPRLMMPYFLVALIGVIIGWFISR